MNIIKNSLLIIVSLAISITISTTMGNWYLDFYGGGSWVDVTSFIGLPLAYLLLIPLVFCIFGDKNKYWWIGLSILPAVGFELYFDFRHFYLPVAIVALGLLIGYAFSVILSKYTYLAKRV